MMATAFSVATTVINGAVQVVLPWLQMMTKIWSGCQGQDDDDDQDEDHDCDSAAGR